MCSCSGSSDSLLGSMARLNCPSSSLMKLKQVNSKCCAISLRCVAQPPLGSMRMVPWKDLMVSRLRWSWMWEM